MVYAKNKYSSKIHLSRTRTSNNDTSFFVRKITFGIIIIAILYVSIYTICAFFLSPERLTKSQISTLATHYYEDYFYDTLTIDNPQVMEEYSTLGFSKISLRQLVLADQSHSVDTTYLEKYCDDSSTFVQFFPTSPYGKSDYRTEFTYSCSF